MDAFLANELIRWPSFAPFIQSAMLSTPVFAGSTPTPAPAAAAEAAPASVATAATTPQSAPAPAPAAGPPSRWELFHQRVTEHVRRPIA